MKSAQNSHDQRKLLCKNQKAWAAWLSNNHAATGGVWLRIAKKGSGATSVTYDQALETALCYGWIDGQKNPEDDSYWLQKFGPRGPKSVWSKNNRDRAEKLIQAGRMKPAGVSAVNLAKADGRWDAAYDSARTAGVPADLQARLDKNAKAKAFFATLTSANRYAILYRIQTAQKPETRAKRIDQFVEMLERHQTIHPQ